MEAAGDLVGASAELAAGVEGGHDGFQGGPAGGGVGVHRDAPAIVGDGDLAPPVDGDVHPVAESGHRLVDGVVEDLVDQVVQSPLVGGADVHAGSDPDGLQSLQHLDVGGGVVGAGCGVLPGLRVLLGRFLQGADGLRGAVSPVCRSFLRGIGSSLRLGGVFSGALGFLSLRPGTSLFLRFLGLRPGFLRLLARSRFGAVCRGIFHRVSRLLFSQVEE